MGMIRISKSNDTRFSGIAESSIHNAWRFCVKLPCFRNYGGAWRTVYIFSNGVKTGEFPSGNVHCVCSIWEIGIGRIYVPPVQHSGRIYFSDVG